MKLPLEWIAEALGSPSPSDALVTGYSIDTRTLEPGDLFFAIRGERRDGHGFVTAALELGAVAAVVGRDWEAPAGAAVLRVDDPVEALGRVAAAARERWGGALVAITGSNGKTTTKEILATLLGQSRKVCRSAGNLNNELGLPLSILRIDDAADAAVLELGMNHAGEMRRLARIARPSVGLVTNVSAAHVGAFGSLEEVALAKRELIEELGPEATAVLAADDARVKRFAEIHRGRTVTFGAGEEADFQAVEIESNAQGSAFSLLARGKRVATRYQTSLPGRHNVLNIVAALAAVSLFGVALESLAAAVATLEPAPMRGQLVERGGVKLLNDCYNSNPAAAAAMLDLLALYEGERRVAVLGEMRELGERSAELHRELGLKAAATGVDLLVGVGGDAREMVAASGLGSQRAFFYSDADEAGEALAAMLRPGDRALFKGSRGVGLERALERVLKGLEG